MGSHGCHNPCESYVKPDQGHKGRGATEEENEKAKVNSNNSVEDKDEDYCNSPVSYGD